MRLLLLGDSPFLRTGFGVVNEQAMQALLEEGHELTVLGGQDSTERPDAPVEFIPTNLRSDDMIGWSQVPQLFTDHTFDAAHIIGDMATVSTWLLHKEIHDLPVVAYVPIEGAPFNRIWRRVLDDSPNLRLITCSNYGKEVLANEFIHAKMAYHGVSDDFAPLEPDVREDWRQRAGWADRFVVMCVAQNVGRKQWPRLFEAIHLVSKRVPNVLLYAHTLPYNNFWLGGHDLTQLVEQIGIEKHVVFSRAHTSHNAAVELRAQSEIEPGLVDLYGMADCFVLPSQVEGFGLPIVEAMKCGLPVAVTDYAAGAEVLGDAGIRLPVSDWTWDKSHAKYANVNPVDIADAIAKFARNTEIRAQYRRRSLERAKLFRWDDYRGLLKEMFGAGFQEAVRPKVLDQGLQG